MDLPRQFSYRPSWRIIFALFIIGFAVLTLAVFARASSITAVAFSAPFLSFGLIITLRRILFPKWIELDRDKLSIFAGVSRSKKICVFYADIEFAWEVRAPQMTVLKLRAKERTVEIVSSLLQDKDSYVAIKDFVFSRVKSNPAPTASEKAQSVDAHYLFNCSYEGSGEICDSNKEVLWVTNTPHFNGRPHYPYGLFRLPDFVVQDKTGVEIYRIKLERKLPLARFAMIKDGVNVCAIRQQSLLRNKYVLEFANGQKWVFHMPLFSVNFKGCSETGGIIRVRVWLHNVWGVLVERKVDCPELVAALAFIHREHLRFN